MAQVAAGHCGVDLSTVRHAVEKLGIDPPGPPRPCDDVPGLEVSLDKPLNHRLIEFYVRKEALKACVNQLKLLSFGKALRLEAFGLGRFHPAI